MPLKLRDGGVVLVNRGWLPRNMNERTAIAPYDTPKGEELDWGRPRLYGSPVALGSLLRFSEEAVSNDAGVRILQGLSTFEGVDSSGDEITYFSEAQLPRSIRRHRSLQNGDSGLPRSTGLPQIGHFNVIARTGWARSGRARSG